MAISKRKSDELETKASTEPTDEVYQGERGHDRNRALFQNQTQRFFNHCIVFGGNDIGDWRGRVLAIRGAKV
jgi:hypothetical protein